VPEVAPPFPFLRPAQDVLMPATAIRSTNWPVIGMTANPVRIRQPRRIVTLAPAAHSTMTRPELNLPMGGDGFFRIVNGCP
jgi:hypothetical protein